MAKLIVDEKGRQPHAESKHNVTRIIETDYYNQKVEIFDNRFDICPNEFVVIDDMDMGYRSNREHGWERMLRMCSEKTTERANRSPRIIAMLGRSLPSLGNKGDDLWGKLLKDHRDETIVVVNADLLRVMGAEISRRVSWERTAQELITFLHSGSELARLAAFSQLIVRFGITAAIHCFNPGSDARYRLFYDTKSDNGYFRDVNEEGGIIGNNSVFAAYLIKAFLKYRESNHRTRPIIGEAIRGAIPACQRMHRLGYPPFVSNRDWLKAWPSASVFDEQRYLATRSPSNHHKNIWREENNHHGKARLKENIESTEPTTELLVDEIEVPRGADRWSILIHSTVGSALLDTARNIVLFGVKKAVNHPPRPDWGDTFTPVVHTFAPKARFNNLVTLDRDEIESFRGVYNIIKEYIISDQKTPLSIAVFGPPGSGKSFAVDEIANASVCQLATTTNSSKLEKRKNINMSQIDTLKDLIDSLEALLGSYRFEEESDDRQNYSIPLLIPDIRQTADLNRIPFVFFDEFDCNHTGHLGWLKTFLSPMEDAYVSVERGKLNLSRSIFVFAGGTTLNYKDFSCDSLPPTDQNRIDFIAAKGLDFVSRLRGHIDIKGINPLDPTDKGFIIRRAVLLRKYFKEFHYTQQTEFAELASVDYGVLDAMLMVDSYKHGARSMRALLAMCAPLNRRIEKASLPATAQLEMHVNSSEFYSIMREHRHPVQRHIRMDQHILT